MSGEKLWEKLINQKAQQHENNIRKQRTTEDSLFPGVISPQVARSSASKKNEMGRPVSSREKVKLSPGHSPLDWAALSSSGKNLRGIDPSQFPMRVTKQELKLHKAEDDCWMVLRGRRVYNVTPYLHFHPGGVKKLMLCAGRDGTELFEKYHAWVNAERMLENCFVGFYVG